MWMSEPLREKDQQVEMDILAEIRKLYDGPYNHGNVFTDDLAAHIERGCVHGSPACFGMARYVRSDWSVEQISDLARTAPLDDADCLFVWLAVGNMAELLAAVPREVEFVCFFRRGFPRLYKFKQLKARCTSISSHRPPLSATSTAESPP
jgi:hypothetical protein